MAADSATNMSPATKPFLLKTHGVGALVAAVLAVVLFLVVSWRDAPLQELRDYVATTGIVVSFAADRRLLPTHGRGSVFYDLEVAYRYTVAGKEHRGSRYAARPRREDAAAVERLRRTHQPGAPCEVWYDPAEPEQSVLTREAGYDTSKLSQYLPPAAWGLLVLGALNLVVLAWRWPRA